MARYRVYLSDAADYVQESVSIDCQDDDEAIDVARTLIKADGRVEVWNNDTTVGPLVGSLMLNPGILSSALVKRCRQAPAARTGLPPPLASDGTGGGT